MALQEIYPLLPIRLLGGGLGLLVWLGLGSRIAVWQNHHTLTWSLQPQLGPRLLILIGIGLIVLDLILQGVGLGLEGFDLPVQLGDLLLQLVVVLHRLYQVEPDIYRHQRT